MKNETKAIAKTIHASTTAAVIDRSKKAGASRRPNSGIKFPIILDLALSLIFPATTTMIKQNTMKRKGNGTTSPGGGMHFVPSLFNSFPSSQVLIVGMQASPAAFGS